MELKRIGTIHTVYTAIEQCPKNTRFAHASAQIVIDPAYAPALLDLSSASHLIVLYWLDQAQRDVLQIDTVRADGQRRGVLATRSPHRPNPIGLAVVRLHAVHGTTLSVSGLDCVDGTTLLDIKPYFAANDAFPEASVSWQDSVQAD